MNGITRLDLMSRADRLTIYTGVQYRLDKMVTGYRLETVDGGRDISPRLSPSKMMDWIDAAIRGAEELFLSPFKYITFFDSSDRISILAPANWYCTGDSILAPDVLIAQRIFSKWVITIGEHSGKAFPNWTIGK